MVHFASFEERQRQIRPPGVAGEMISVKLEIEESLVDEHGPFNKKQKQSSSADQFLSGNNIFPAPPSQYNPLEEPSPLGLRLRKSPSLLELIQMRLSQGKPSTSGSVPDDDSRSQEKSNTKGSAPGATDKLKASNFPASLLKIGCWEYTSRYEGDLVAKCYFAKHKLVWEILEGGLKSKIEVQWSDIMGLKADIPDEAPATLIVVLARQPLFFRETNPQPRKHTLWQATADFTNGQASLHRKHFLQVPHGLLNKHFEKLIQCDMRLSFLSRQPEIKLDSPYFDSQPSIFDDSNECKNYSVNQRETSRGPSTSIFEDVGTPSASQTSSLSVKQEDAVNGASEILSREATSPSSVMDMRVMEGSTSSQSGELNGSKSVEQLIMRGIRPSMSMTDLVNHIGNCISEQMSSENPECTEGGSESHTKMLEDIAQHLLGDVQFTPCSDEKSLMSRVNSLCSLLQKDGTPVQTFEVTDEAKDLKTTSYEPELMDQNTIKGDIIAAEGSVRDVCKQAPSMPRIDSFGDLLHHLPRIASLPKFLFDISEDGDNQAR
ncbi:uncharacterized protein LOC104901744 [Beta vulgaris subsp. vulgaris]|uniref:uncharacterized protein LOC104901744 n=1 Tax=Beta vulgaris subsp. vulgaris TaxID=3555 RepID=UPI002037210C|nr:uncharacterized protein LOC104901744 [Beta vulgaris subsp. vulgaris]